MRMRLATHIALLTAAPLAAQLLPSDAIVTASAVDSAGSIYVAGSVYSADLPTTPEVFEPVAPQNVCGYFDGKPVYCQHAFVAKFPSSGDRLLWASYLQGDGADTITAMAVDPEGRIFVAGSTTSRKLLYQPGLFAPRPFQQTPAHLFLYQISSDGRYLLSGTFFGGSAQDTIGDITLDTARHVYIAGTAVSDPFPTAPGAYQQIRDKDFYDQYVTEFDPSFSRLLLSTLIGKTDATGANVLALGADSTVYIAGGIGTFPISPVFGPIVSRLSGNGTSLLYSTILPNTSPAGFQLGVFSLAVDSLGNAYAGTDNRTFYVYPYGTITKLDPQGNIVARQDIDGRVSSLALGTDGTLFVFGYASDQLATTPGAPAACAGPEGFYSSPYVAEADTSTLKISYAGYMTNGISQVAPGKILVGASEGPFRLAQTGPPSAGTINCVENSASHDNAVIAPGELATVTGYQIGPEQPSGPVLDSAGNVTSEIGGLSVWIAGLPAPLLYVSNNQINMVAPFGIPTRGTVLIELRQNGTIVGTFDQTAWPEDPGLFTTNSAGQLAALNQDGSVNSPNNPATKGSIVAIFATGLGAMTPEPADGSRPSEPVAMPVNCPGVWIGGQTAEIDYCGNAPGLIEGVVQINFRVPFNVTPNSPPSNAVSVSLIENGNGASLGLTSTIAVE